MLFRSFAYQCGSFISASLVTLQAVLAEHMSYATTMATTAAIVFIGASIVAALGRERRGQVFGEASSAA